MRVYENQRQCGGVGSSSSRCGVFPGTETSRRSGPIRRSQPLQREALEACMAGRWRRGLGRQTPSWSQAEVISDQKQQLVTILKEGPSRAGFSTDLWTTARVAKVVRKKFRISYHPDHVGRILHDLGFSPQKPQQVAREQDTAAVERWRKQDWPRIKKKPGDATPALSSSMKRAFACSL